VVPGYMSAIILSAARHVRPARQNWNSVKLMETLAGPPVMPQS
jgi:hypothetical protein